MDIGYLADHEVFLPSLARWHHQEWAYRRPGDTIEARTGRLRAACGRQQIPTVFVAFSGAELYGSAMLVSHDMDTRIELSPWLAGVFVRRSHRGVGIGGALVRRVVEEASNLGISRLYLYTPGTERFYARLGWRFRERTDYRGTKEVVMMKEVTPNQSAEATPAPAMPAAGQSRRRP
jgi:predicted N-acetyltransferase YhbS